MHLWHRNRGDNQSVQRHGNGAKGRYVLKEEIDTGKSDFYIRRFECVKPKAVKGSGVQPDRGEDGMSRIGGIIQALPEAQAYKIIIYAHTDKWYIQPNADQPYTGIASDGTWENRTHLGKSYAVLLVKAAFVPVPLTETLAVDRCRKR